jgi:5-methyltetrahydrofolate--homocysteine methyltransferase
MSTFLERIQSGGTLLSDGATGTYLQQNGLEAGGCPEAFNESHPDVVRGMAREYFEAGSDMVETNTFGGSRYMLKKYGHGDRVEALNRLGAEHARAEAPDGHYVLGSIGPTGEFIEPNGTATEAEMLEVFCEQARGLAAGGIDAYCIETMSDMAETSLAIKAAKEVSALPVVATLTFDSGKRGYFTMFGITPTAAAEQLAEAGADIVGSNCGLPIAHMIPIITAMRAATSLPILTHINAGIPNIVKNEIVYPDRPEQMAAEMPKIIEAGANIIGGCCGTGPSHVRAFAELLGK